MHLPEDDPTLFNRVVDYLHRGLLPAYTSKAFPKGMASEEAEANSVSVSTYIVYFR